MKKLTALVGSGQTQPNASQQGNSRSDFAAIVPVISGQIGGRETNIVSAKALYVALGVGRDFSTWFSERVEEYGFIRGVDYFSDEDVSGAWLLNDQYSPIPGKNKGRGRPQKDYYPNITTAKELAMVERNEQGGLSVVTLSSAKKSYKAAFLRSPHVTAASLKRVSVLLTTSSRCVTR